MRSNVGISASWLAAPVCALVIASGCRQSNNAVPVKGELAYVAHYMRQLVRQPFRPMAMPHYDPCDTQSVSLVVCMSNLLYCTEVEAVSNRVENAQEFTVFRAEVGVAMHIHELVVHWGARDAGSGVDSVLMYVYPHSVEEVVRVARRLAQSTLKCMVLLGLSPPGSNIFLKSQGRIEGSCNEGTSTDASGSDAGVRVGSNDNAVRSGISFSYRGQSFAGHACSNEAVVNVVVYRSRCFIDPSHIETKCIGALEGEASYPFLVLEAGDMPRFIACCMKQGERLVNVYSIPDGGVSYEALGRVIQDLANGGCAGWVTLL